MVDDDRKGDDFSTLDAPTFARRPWGVAQKLWLGFGLMLLLMIVNGLVSLRYIGQIDGDLLQIVEIEETLEQAVLEMEINAGETAQFSVPIPPIPLTVATDPRKVALGDRLFHDPILSFDETVSCASCHDLAKGGDDGRPTSRGINNSVGAMNAPTVLNSGFNVAQFWDGRARTLEEQVAGPIQNLAEMGSNWSTVLERLRRDETYGTAFRAIYDDGVQIANVKNVIAEFERSLITPNSRFDRFLRGDGEALTTEEREGYVLFKDLGCVSCHQGVNMGGNLFQRLGIIIDYFTGTAAMNKQNFGRFNVTGREEDRFVFKVPSLRNVDLTAPYLHDGSVADLKTVVKVMAKYQLGRRLAPKNVDRMVAFLKTLTGERREASR